MQENIFGGVDIGDALTRKDQLQLKTAKIEKKEKNTGAQSAVEGTVKDKGAPQTEREQSMPDKGQEPCATASAKPKANKTAKPRPKKAASKTNDNSHPKPAAEQAADAESIATTGSSCDKTTDPDSAAAGTNAGQGSAAASAPNSSPAAPPAAAAALPNRAPERTDEELADAIYQVCGNWDPNSLPRSWAGKQIGLNIYYGRLSVGVKIRKPGTTVKWQEVEQFSSKSMMCNLMMSNLWV